jgi:hypothetical protein
MKKGVNDKSTKGFLVEIQPAVPLVDAEKRL